MAGNTGVQMGGWFNKEINSSDDLKGLKMRIPGLGGDVMAKLGASPVSLPGTQIYENLVSGAIDATEWVGPWNDSFMKFYEAAKFYYYPGMHEPGSMLSFGMNASWWGKLTKSDQAAIEAATGLENDMMMAEYNAKNGAALARLLSEQASSCASSTTTSMTASARRRTRSSKAPGRTARWPTRSTRASSRRAGMSAGGPRFPIRPISPSATACWMSDA